MNQSLSTTNTCTQPVLSAGKCLRTTRDWSFFCHWLVENLTRDFSANHQPMTTLLTSSINYSSSPTKNASIERKIVHFKTVTSSGLPGGEAEEMVLNYTFHSPPSKWLHVAWASIKLKISWEPFPGVLYYGVSPSSQIYSNCLRHTLWLRARRATLLGNCVTGENNGLSYKLCPETLCRTGGVESGSLWIGFDSTELTDNYCVFDETHPEVCANPVRHTTPV